MSTPAVIVSNRTPHKLAIIALVLSKSEGDVITDPEINEATGAKIRHWNSAMQAARRVLDKEHHIVLWRDATITPRGYRYLRPGEKSGAADRQMKRARNRVKAACRIVDTVDDVQFAAMSAGEKSVYVQSSARVRLAEDLFGGRALKQPAIVTNTKERPILPK